MSALQPHHHLLPSSPLKMNVLQSNQTSNIAAVKSDPDLKRVTSARADSTGNENTFLRHHHSVKKPQTPSVSRRNARERNRVKQVNNGFSTLRTHIPHLKNKTSKVDTLRAAVDYIRALRRLLGDPVDEDSLHQGPILISEVGDGKEESDMSEADLSLTASPPRSASAQSFTELNPMVYQLPPVSINDFLLKPVSPTGSASPNSDIDSSSVAAVTSAAFQTTTSTSPYMSEVVPVTMATNWWGQPEHLPTTSAN